MTTRTHSNPFPSTNRETDCKELIARMRAQHTGMEKGIVTSDLLLHLHGPCTEHENMVFRRRLQADIEYINTHMDGMICSDSVHGYWWAASLKDGLPAAQARVRRAKKQLYNASCLDKNIRRHFGGQEEIDDWRTDFKPSAPIDIDIKAFQPPLDLEKFITTNKGEQE